MKVLIGSIIVAAMLIMCMGCESLPECGVCCPVCEECSDGVEEPYLCSKYYADKNSNWSFKHTVPIVCGPNDGECGISTCERVCHLLLVGSHDFFLEGDDKMTSSTLATKCLTCGIYFTHPSYGEHIKTCCP